MKKIVALFFIACIFYGCTIDNTPGNDLGSFPGALDSIGKYGYGTGLSSDSANYNAWWSTTYFKYDDLHRVVLMTGGPTFYRTYYYQGNNNLPYLFRDSTISSGVPVTDIYSFYIAKHFLSYDNFNNLTVDSTVSYTRKRDNPVFPEYIIPSMPPTVIRFKFQSNYSTYTYQTTIVIDFHDTTYFNSVGDVKTMNFQGYQQRVDEYYTIKNPLSQLNIAPLYNVGGNYGFQDIVGFLNLNISQPKFLFKKVSGTNPHFYTYQPNDFTEGFFYPKTDADNRLTHLVTAKYTHAYTPTGVSTDKYYLNFRFFYHN